MIVWPCACMGDSCFCDQTSLCDMFNGDAVTRLLFTFRKCLLCVRSSSVSAAQVAYFLYVFEKLKELDEKALGFWIIKYILYFKKQKGYQTKNLEGFILKKNSRLLVYI